MKYWQCIHAGGVPHSYCGINQICCMDPPPRAAGASSRSSPASNEAVDSSLDPNEADSIIFSTSFNSLLNAPAKQTQCGVKGFDSNRDGISDPGEWGWHVSEAPFSLSLSCLPPLVTRFLPRRLLISGRPSCAGEACVCARTFSFMRRRLRMLNT